MSRKTRSRPTTRPDHPLRPVPSTHRGSRHRTAAQVVFPVVSSTRLATATSSSLRPRRRRRRRPLHRGREGGQGRRTDRGHRAALRGGMACRAHRTRPADRHRPRVRPRPPDTRRITRPSAWCTRPTARVASPALVRPHGPAPKVIRKVHARCTMLHLWKLRQRCSRRLSVCGSGRSASRGVGRWIIWRRRPG